LNSKLRKIGSLPITVLLSLNTALILAVGLSVSVGYFYGTSKSLLLDGAIKTLSETMLRRSERIQDTMFNVENDIAIISNMDNVIKFIAAENSQGSKDNNLRKRIESDISIILQSNGYLQIRLISSVTGKEILRVDNVANKTINTEDKKLQYKGDKNYILKGRSLKRGEVYYSPISLNRENGFIQQPWVPTQRFVSPVFDAEGNHMNALIVINTDVQRIIDGLDKSKLFEMTLINNNGDTLYNIDSSLSWGFEFDVLNGFRFQYPRTWDWMSSNAGSLILDLDNDELFIVNRIMLDESEGSFLGIVMRLNREEIYKDAEGIRNEIQAFSVIIFIVSIVAVFFMLRQFVKPMRELGDQVNRIIKNNMDAEISVSGSQEINRLALIMSRLLENLKLRHDQEILHTEKVEMMNSSLEHKVSMRTQDIVRSSRDERLITALLSKALEDDPQKEYLLKTLFYLFDNLPWLSDCKQSFVYLKDEREGVFIRTVMTDDTEDGIRMSYSMDISDPWLVSFIHKTKVYYDVNIPCSYSGEQEKSGGYILPILQNDKMIGFLCMVVDVEKERDGKSLILLNRISNVLSVGISSRINQQNIIEAKEEAESANKVKSEFLAIVSHEIRTPMNSIIGFTNLILRNRDNLTERQKDALQTVESSSNELLGIINGILDFSKMDASTMKVENGPFSIRDLLAVQKISFSEVLMGSSFEFKIDTSELQVESAVGDEEKIAQIVRIFLDNAFKYTETGSVALFAKSSLLKGNEKNSERIALVIGVVDTGIGIPYEKLEDIFKPFTQVESYLTRKHSGTGMGLAICKKISDLMGAQIWVTSEKGVGSTFHLALDLSVEMTVSNERSQHLTG